MQDRCKGKLKFKTDLHFEDVGYEGDGIVSYWICEDCGKEHEVIHDFELDDEYLQLKGAGI